VGYGPGGVPSGGFGPGSAFGPEGKLVFITYLKVTYVLPDLTESTPDSP